jgi:hypothetical protein
MATDMPDLTLTELVTSVAGSVPRIRRDLVKRRLAHWSSRGVLKPIGQLHVGSGRSRLFDPEQAYIAAVLLRLPVVTIGRLKVIAQAITTSLATDDDTARLWATARGHWLRLTVFATFGIVLDSTGERPISDSFRLIVGQNRMLPAIEYSGSLIIVNLTDAFAGVRFP